MAKATLHSASTFPLNLVSYCKQSNDVTECGEGGQRLVQFRVLVTQNDHLKRERRRRTEGDIIYKVGICSKGQRD